jgi:hypothetical protein
MTKWYWPTWADWLQVYDQPVTNLANKGYGNQNIYWILLDKINSFTEKDHINIMWAENHRIGLWYDEEWVKNKQVAGFFPATEGKIWFSKDNPYMGLYRTHPDLYSSFTNMIVDQLQIIYQTQLLLEKIGCSYTMHSSKNIWADGRPKFYPRYKTVYQEKDDISAGEIQTIKQITELSPIKNLINLIDWTKFINPPKNPFNPKEFSGIWEYFINNKEYVVLKHETDHHPNSLAHHDYALELILNQNPKLGKHRELAKKISQETINMPIPEFSPNDFIIDSTEDLLSAKYKELLESLR